MKLHSKNWTRREIEQRVGRIEQIGGIKRYHLAGGKTDGVEQVQLRTGAGLTYYINVSRGMDISLAEYSGTPLSWQSSNGDVHPAFWRGAALDWLETAVGGLLMTCGLTQVGSPCTDGDESLGLHGDVHLLAAELLRCEGEWTGDEYIMTVKGRLRHSRYFSENIVLTRTIRSHLGKNKITIDDSVENAGFQKVPHMLLYHFNFGFPLISEDTELNIPSGRITARDKDIPVEDFDHWQAPTAGYCERVYYHEDLKSVDKIAEATIRQPRFPIGGSLRPISVKLSWDTTNLPLLVQWKAPGEGTHVLGLEPANCHVEGRIVERERGSLQYLEPGEKRDYHVTLEIIDTES